MASLLGVGLRLQVVRAWTTLDYGHLLHTHSHVAFLGWVFNAFFVVALRHFIPPETAGHFDWLWWTMQVAVIGMLATFPFQGYGAASIAFSALHMAASIAFARRLWCNNRASPAARTHLRTALGFMLLSGLGPLALGPLAALGFRDSAAYTLAIYFYLHCQYNGWFPFFLQALFLQRAHECGHFVSMKGSRRAARWLTVGGLLTYALSTLWLDPPWWVNGAAILGSTAQIVGCLLLYHAARRSGVAGLGFTRIFVVVAITAWWLKHLLQFLGPWPGLVELTQQRFVAIAFLHLVFLGMVTPALIAWALGEGYLNDKSRFRLGGTLYLFGVAISELLLATPIIFAALGPSGWALPSLLLAATVLIAAGILLMSARAQSRYNPMRPQSTPT